MTPIENKKDKPEIEKEIPVEKKQDDVIKVELSKLDEMRKSGSDIAHIMAQFFTVMTHLHHRGARNDKIFALDKRPEMEASVKKSKETYNGRSVLLITGASAALTIVGGAFTGLGAFAATDTLSKLGGGIAGVGNGTGILGKFAENASEAARTKHSHDKQKHQTQHDDRHQSHTTSIRSGREALEKASQTHNSLHSAVTEMLRSRSA